MSVTTLNLGILAHVDAGKTTLTERLLYAAGAIDELGSVDAGTTRTDSMELERRRGITIRSAVASFTVDGVTVNLVDTPGHPDFIAEVERALSVLDGAVLVLSAVDGVQPQTRILMRALQRLRIPTLLFVNKVDRAGADPDRVLAAISSWGRHSAGPGPSSASPTLHADVEIPAEDAGPVLTALGRLGAAVTAHRPRGDMFTIQALLPAAHRPPDTQPHDHEGSGSLWQPGVFMITDAGDRRGRRLSAAWR